MAGRGELCGQGAAHSTAAQCRQNVRSPALGPSAPGQDDPSSAPALTPFG